MNTRELPVGVMDSGLGGLSVLREAVRIMPQESFIYFGDSKHAPYGMKTVEEIRELTFRAVDFLLEKGVKEIIVACNTATSAAVRILRQMYPEVPVIGIEPALKPAVIRHPHGKVIVMATPMTLRQEKFHRLMESYRDKADIFPLPCAELVEFIERGELSGNALEEYLVDKLAPWMHVGIDAVVLGCTHFPFVKSVISRIAGGQAEILDGSEGTARYARYQLEINGLLSDRQDEGTVHIYNSSEDDALIRRSEQLLAIPCIEE